MPTPTVTVFVVDDEADNIELYKRALPHYQVREFTRPAEALPAVVAENPACLVVDYRMPDLSGIELVKKCRAAGYEGGALMVTAFADLDEVVYAEQINLIYRIVPKPVEGQHLREQVDLMIADTRFRENYEGRRRHPRFLIPLTLEILVGGKRVSVMADNISRGGVLLEGDINVQPGDQVRLFLTHQGKTLEALGTVMHAGPRSAGVMFSEEAKAFQDALGEVINQHRYGDGRRSK